jgi:DNA-binding NtrC family response regulator
VGLSEDVLILDEDINLRLSMAQILRGAGYGVSTACSPCEALKQLSAQSFGLVMLDIGLMAGVEMSLVADIERSYPGLPLLVLIPYMYFDEKMKDSTSRGAHFLVKPVDPVKILEEVRQIIIG